MAISNSNTLSLDYLQDNKFLKEGRRSLREEPIRVSESGERFLKYFAENASEDGVLFKTIKEITTDLNIPHQSLTKVLKILEHDEIIYRRNGIIGLWKE